ncbi:MAG: sulfide/dihydroorotate dehydrogenase-like FAD/NAD-binding protein [Promethearchaeota archaeon]
MVQSKKIEFHEEIESEWDICDSLSILVKNLELENKVKISKLSIGKCYLYYDIWQEKCRENNTIYCEKNYEILVGVVESLNPLIFSKALYLNTCQNVVLFAIKNKGLPEKTIELIQEMIPVETQLFDQLTEQLNSTNWNNKRSFSSKTIIEFIKLLQEYFEYKEKEDIQSKKAKTQYNQTHTMTESQNFIDKFINKIEKRYELEKNKQNKVARETGTEGNEKEYCNIYFDVWRIPFKDAGTTKYEQAIELIIESQEEVSNIKSVEHLRINTYHGFVEYKAGKTLNSNIFKEYKKFKLDKKIFYALKKKLKEYINLRGNKNNKNIIEIKTYNQKAIEIFINFFLSTNIGNNLSNKSEIIQSKKENKEDIYTKIIESLEKIDSAKGRFIINETCISYDFWRIPYRDNNDLIYDEYMEIIVGPVKSTRPLVLSEAFCFNSYYSSLRYIPKSVVLEQPNTATANNRNISLPQEFYEELKENMRIDEWDKEVCYKPKILNKFKQILLQNLNLKVKKEEEINKPKIEINENDIFKDFETGDFYEPLINILLNQDNVKLDNLEIGKDYIYFTTWHEAVRNKDKIEYETCLELIIGRTKQLQPLTFSKAFYLNTYHGNLRYTENNLTIEVNRKKLERELIAVRHELFDRLNIILKPKKWAKEITYNKKLITPFVRTIENYFLGRYEGKNYQILNKKILYKSNKDFGSIIDIEIKAKEIAKMAEPGQFVVLRLHERGERFPLTIVDTDLEKGTIRLIYQVVGKSTQELNSLNIGDYILDVLGPLGTAIEVKKYNKPIICIAGGVGAASIYSKVKSLKLEGNYIILILGAKTKEQLILLDEFKNYCDELYLTTDDGNLTHDFDGNECIYKMRKDGTKTYGGFVNYILEALIGQDYFLNLDNNRIAVEKDKFIGYGPSNLVGKYKLKDIEEIIAVGPIPMMWSIVKTLAQNEKYRADLHYSENLPKLYVSLNPIMIDGTGMCGGCRINIFNPAKSSFEKKFACVDGPVFNGFLVDFDMLVKRTLQYKIEEQKALKFLEVLGW